MFTHLTDFKFRRTTKQAVGFYIVYLMGTVLLAGLISYIYMSMSGQSFSPEDESFSAGARVGSKVVMVIVLILSILILNAKKLTHNSRSIIIVLIAVAFTFVGGGLLGFIPVAYLTTLESLKKVKEI